MTLSVLARTADAASLGVAIASSSPAVAARCAHGRTQVGVVATQNVTDPALAPQVLDALAQGLDARAAGELALAGTPFSAFRQLIVMSRFGAPFIHTGERVLGVGGQACGVDVVAAGNLLASREVPEAMVRGFESSAGSLGGRLLNALGAGLAAGGEAGPVHSAGLLVFREVSWPIVDLRIDWSDEDPLGALIALWQRYSPQIEDYVQRAIDPTRAPSFAVPGDS
jgi:uncharacterized Ntn-hydrolase superfamily protein